MVHLFQRRGGGGQVGAAARTYVGRRLAPHRLFGQAGQEVEHVVEHAMALGAQRAPVGGIEAGRGAGHWATSTGVVFGLILDRAISMACAASMARWIAGRR